MVTQEQLVDIVEALLFASDEPMAAPRIKRIVRAALREETGPRSEIPAPEAPMAAPGGRGDLGMRSMPVRDTLGMHRMPARSGPLGASGAEPAAPGERGTLDAGPESETPAALELPFDLDAALEAALNRVKEKYRAETAPLVVLELAEGLMLATNPRYANFVKKLYKERTSFRLSQAALETLAIIAYKAPLTRAEIEHIRGVESIAALETLLERNLIKVDGRKETVGRPLLYTPTVEFLRQFGLKNLGDLPKFDRPETAVAALSESAPEESPQDKSAESN